ncbi:TPA: DUF5397 domain-containing protein [Haemophilus influenzae]|uniref:Uncharacterized protein HI_0451 n=5 Tax=Haemophilus influenzae TaxID=727 RepID=Y451_HAEIN|nr:MULTISPECIES: DUF5397 domain-containing protein [Haemophilus]P43998.1 RecName: Full=Uncharacterized protein HI_0451 [Haemophilus influenzae Rd KW20]ABQ97639.1 hypothetical protein CGSHiEE_00735 [Haemophilus influenzae PittEE]EDJ88978.1 hypothetical protein CGSHi22121_07390 [Haemophilus influenzae 22.1-21]EDJ91542.1 hypothetical protein CGSHi22421_07222 [Haemophilus influenzae R3021]EDK14867.1 hypothetical protein CGSHiR3021_10180 [Haemophilus influenzae 22.4-21]CVP30898.1 Uncharacterised p
MELRQQIPTGCIKQFGQFGVPYVVGEVAEFLPDGDVLVNITLLQSGEKDIYRLSHLLEDPEAE